MFALSPSQEAVWLHEQLLEGSLTCQSTVVVDLWGYLSTDALGRALTDTCARHRGLRLELVPSEAGVLPGQRVDDHAVPRVRRVDLSRKSDPGAAFTELLAAEAATPIDPYEAPLMRWTLVRLDRLHHRVIHVGHHLVHDGRSFDIMLREVFECYHIRTTKSSPGAAPIARPARSYEEYVAELNGFDNRYRRAQAMEFWREELEGAAFGLPLPWLDRTGTRRRGVAGRLRQAVDAGLAARLRELSRDQGHTPFTTLLALFAELLRLHTSLDDLVIGTAVDNRPMGHRKTIGRFENNLPLRLRPNGTSPARSAVDGVSDALFRCLPHQHLPVRKPVCAWARPTAGRRGKPLLPGVMFSSLGAQLPQVDLPQLGYSLFERYGADTPRCDLDVVLLPYDRRVGGPGMTLVWNYDRDVFSEGDVELLASRLEHLLHGYLADPTAPFASTAHEATALPLSAAAAPDREPSMRLFGTSGQQPTPQALPLPTGGGPNWAQPRRLVTESRRIRLWPVAEQRQVPGGAAADDPLVEVVGEGWRVVLEHDRFVQSSHFFHVGGHSLLVVRLAAWLEPRLGHRPPLKVLLQNPVLRDQVEALREIAEERDLAHGR
ncbi:condensation domain-containing protein [Streptomyces lavendulae]|uniref:condensation domain-containing protein n=1 Tax=Streptomyces lavendulae TaxID=1914 RepID=UPI00371B94AE